MTQKTPPDRPQVKDHFFDTVALRGQVTSLSGKSGAFTLAISLIKAVLLVATTTVMARLIPPDEFGVIALAMPILFVASSLSQMGLTQAIAQKEEMTHKLASDLFWLGMCAGLAISLLMIPAGQAVTIYFESPAAAVVFPVLGLSVFFGVLTGQFLALYWRLLRIREAETINVAAIVISSASGIVAALLGASYWAVVVQQLMMPFTNMILLFWRMGWLPSAPGRLVRSELRESISFGGYLALANVLLQVSQSLGVLFAGRAFTEVQASLYYRSWNLSRMPTTLLLLPLGSTFIPSFSRLQNDPDALRALFVRVLSRLAFILMPIGVAIIIAAPEIVLIMLGAQWAAAAPIFAILGLRVIFGPFSSGFRWALVSHGQTKLLFRLSLFHIAFIFCAFYLAQNFGLLGLAAAGVAADIVMTIGVTGFFARRHTALTAADLCRPLGGALIYAACLAGAGLATLQLVPDAPPLARLAAVLGALLCAALLRIALQRDLRSDVLKALPSRCQKPPK